MPDHPVLMEEDIRATPYSITVKWQAGWNGGPEQTFIVEYYSTGMHGIIQNIPDGEGARSYKLTKGIHPKQNYTVAIYAQNTKGYSSHLILTIISTPGMVVNQGMTSVLRLPLMTFCLPCRFCGT